MSKIRHSKIVFPDRSAYAIEYSDELVSLVSQLLRKDKKQRLGSKGGATEIMKHPFFDSIDVKKLLKKEYEASFIPEKGLDPANP